jgi:hypothetical protein
LKIEDREVRSTREREREREMHTHTHTHTQSGSLNNVRVSKKATATQHMEKCAIQNTLIGRKGKKACCVISQCLTHTLKSSAKRSHSSQSWLIWWKTPTDLNV